jgi:serine protease inhibitor
VLGYQLRVANRLWGQPGYPILPGFLALTRQQYEAEMPAGGLRPGGRRQPGDYTGQKTFQALELPYAGNELSMVVLLPKQVDGFLFLIRDTRVGSFLFMGRLTNPTK